MLNQNLSEEKIVIEIRQLMNGIDTVTDEIDAYCDFLKEMFLSGSGRN